MSDQKPYDLLTFDTIGAGRGTPTLKDRVDEMIQRAGHAVQEPGAGAEAVITVKIKVKAIREQSTGNLERVDVSAQPELKLPKQPGAWALGFVPRGSSDLVTADTRQQTMLDAPRGNAIPFPKTGA